jgi:hypothetical protein
LSIQRIIALVIGLVVVVSVTSVQQNAIAQPAEPTPFPLYYLPDATSNRAFSSGSMVITNDGRLLVASNMLSNSVAVVLIVAPGSPEVDSGWT